MFEYTEYNPYTSTGRPSNHFNNVNYAALNKSDGSRKRFRSRFKENGCLIEIDLIGFHLFLIHSILNLPFSANIYEDLGKIYFNKSELTDEEITASKTITFRQLYGGIEHQYRNIEPFKSIQKLIDRVYDDYLKGNLKSFGSGRSIDPVQLHGSSPSKILNYLLQNFELEFNIGKIKQLNLLMGKCNSKLVLYTYDSFLIDYCFLDEKSLLTSIFEVFKGIPFHFKIGHHYDEMRIKNIHSIC